MSIVELETCLQEKATKDEQFRLLMTQPRVGYLTALGVVYTVGDISLFDRLTKQIVSFVGLDPLD